AALLVVRRRTPAAAGLIALSGGMLVLGSEPNARYLYSALPLLSIPFAAMMGWAAANHRPLYGLSIVCAVAATALNIWFLPASSYAHKDLYGPFTAAQREVYLRQTDPLRAVVQWFNRAHPGATVLLTQDSSHAGL